MGEKPGDGLDMYKFVYSLEFTVQMDFFVQFEVRDGIEICWQFLIGTFMMRISLTADFL